MSNLDEIKDRYNAKNRKVVVDILEESKFFIEWAAPESPSHIQELFSEMQSRLALWHRHLLMMREDSREITELAKSARHWSMQLIQYAGVVQW